ncbi:MAG TPA: efflux transporter outer membrane subunit [Burkholderiaceae bacterium]|jgi:multidrug efflux system outer membrane protein
MKMKLAILAAALTLAGCVNLAPDHQRPALAVPDQWPSAALEAGERLNWPQFYAGDARLVALINIALKNNRDLRVAVLNAEQARAQARVSDANRWPTVGAAFIRNRDNIPESTSVPYEAGLQVNAYELDLLGRLRNLSDSATAKYLASVEGTRAAQITLVAGVASSYLALQADTEMEALAQSTLTARQDGEALQRRKFDLGAASALDMATSESASAAARVALAQAKRQRAQDESALALLLGQPLPNDLVAPKALADIALPDVPAGLPSQVLLSRPDVLQAEEQLSAAEANIGAARAAFFPAITLTGTLGTASSQLSQLFKNTIWTFAAQAAMPIFDAGRNRANLDSAKAAQGIAVAQYEKAVQTAFKEVADTLAGRATFGDQLDGQTQAARAANDTLRLVDLRYRNGAASQLELLTAQTNAFAANQALVQTRLAALLNSVQLYKALGGGVASKA